MFFAGELFSASFFGIFRSVSSYKSSLSLSLSWPSSLQFSSSTQTTGFGDRFDDAPAKYSKLLTDIPTITTFYPVFIAEMPKKNDTIGKQKSISRSNGLHCIRISKILADGRKKYGKLHHFLWPQRDAGARDFSSSFYQLPVYTAKIVYGRWAI